MSKDRLEPLDLCRKAGCQDQFPPIVTLPGSALRRDIKVLNSLLASHPHLFHSSSQLTANNDPCICLFDIVNHRRNHVPLAPRASLVRGAIPLPDAPPKHMELLLPRVSLGQYNPLRASQRCTLMSDRRSHELPQ